ncbi:mucoidy inhibitor MuiA family protein [Haliangium ochraceum]|uniref:Mucoidy inhibitor MuiA family protein n=1 Tax=Haliangium ochraceum (strain DSM 14365 / JCM 11303 / SMP-2) TaxID=502025 RepID=D0LFR7_HALO1|nr:mucoidy inhibitor MuiA family protein [Haliangium ochraceum]ACY14519.1 conserved hypothetical protein [Haliangium ochraceum DSM 14365]
MSTIPAVEIPVVEVTLLEDRAHVVRRGEVTAEAGATRVRVCGVAPALVDKSLGAHVLAGEGAGAPEGVRVVDVQVRRRRALAVAERSQDHRQLDDAQHALSRDLAALSDRRSVLEAELRALDQLARLSIAEISEDAAWARGETATWNQQLEDIDGRERELVDTLRQLRFDEREVEARLERLEARRRVGENALGEAYAELEVTLMAEQRGRVSLQIDYVTPGACWRPQHSARLLADDDGRPRVELRSDGCVWQNTGEDWHEVALRFSTQRPSLGVAPPLLAEDRLSVRRKSAEVVAETREQEISTTGVGTEVVEVPEVPGIDDGGEVVSLRAAERASIPSDGAPYRVELFRYQSEAETELLAAAELAPAVILRSEQVNRCAHPLLAGPVDLIREAGLVGRSSVLYIAPGERFELGWGPDTSLRVHRRDERLADESRMLSAWTVQRHKVVVRLSNIGDEPKQIRVKERVPVSEIEKVQISVHAGETTADARPDADGILEWRVDLPAFGRDSVVLRFDVKKHDDVRGL